MSKCGRVFNRHKWRSPTHGYRMCTKCGRTEETFWSQGGGFGPSWVYLTPRIWYGNVCRLIETRAKQNADDEAMREKLLEMIRKDGYGIQ